MAFLLIAFLTMSSESHQPIARIAGKFTLRHAVPHICVYIPTLPASPPSVEQVSSFAASARQTSATYSIYNHNWTESGADTFARLPEKTWTMLRAAPANCDALLKMDSNGMMCTHRLPEDVFTNIHRAYVGRTGPLDHVMTPYRHELKHALTQHALARWRNATLPLRGLFAIGNAYLLGRAVVNFILRHEFEDYVNLGLEDANIGFWLGSMRDVQHYWVKGSRGCEYDEGTVVHHGCRTREQLQNVCARRNQANGTKAAASSSG